MYLFKENEGFSVSQFIGTNVPKDTIEVSDEDVKKLYNHELMWSNGVLVPNPNYKKYLEEHSKELEKRKQISLLKKELDEIHKWFTENDWKPNKIITGEWEKSDSRWLDYIAERIVKRNRQDEINNILEEI